MATVLEIVIRARDQASAVIDRTALSSQGLSRSLSDAGDKMVSAGGKTTRSLTVPLLAAGVGIGKLGADYEEAMSRILGLTEASQQQVNEWSNELLRLGPELGKSPKELAEALYFIVGAGIEGSAAIDALTVSAKASAAGLGRTEVVADAVTSAMNAYAKTGMTAARATDILTAAINFGKLEADQLAPVLGRLLPTASAMGIEFEQVAGILSVFSMTGADAAEGATSLQAIMSTLLKPSKQAGDQLKAVGLTMGDLRKQAAGPDGLIGVMRLLEEKFRGNDEALATIVPNVRAFRGIMNALAQEAGSVDQVLAGVANSTGALDKAFSAAAATNKFAMQQALSELKADMIEISRTVLPLVVRAFSGLTSALGTVMDRWRGMSDEGRKAMVVFAGIAAAAGPAMVALGRLAQLAGALAAGKPFAIAGVAAAGLALGVFLLSQRFDGATREAQRLIDKLRELAAAELGSKDAALTLAEAKHRLAQAKLSVKQATAANTAIQKDEHATDLQKQQAELDITAALHGRKRAQNDVTAATQANADAQEDFTKKEREAREEYEKNKRKLDELAEGARLWANTTAFGELTVAQKRTIGRQAALDYAKAMDVLAKEVAKTAKESKELTPETAKLAREQAATAKAAAALARETGRVPTQLEILQRTARNAGKTVGLELPEGMRKAEQTLVPAARRAVKRAIAEMEAQAPSAREAGRQVGVAAGQGIQAGIGSMVGAIAARAAATVASAIRWARKNTGSTTEQYAARELGVPMGEGVIRGWLLSTAVLPEKVKESVRQAVEAGRRQVERARAVFQRAFGRVGDAILRAFDAKTGAHETPTERRIREIEERREIEDLLQSQADAQARLNQLVAEGGSAEEIARARRDLARAGEDIELVSQRRIAEQERLDFESRREQLRERLEERIRILEQALTREGTTYGNALGRIKKLLADFGVSYKQAGGNLGTAFAKGLRSKVQEAANAAAAIANAVEKALSRSFNISVSVGGQGKAPGRAAGGPVLAGHAYTVGEHGPELFRPDRNGTIIPNQMLGGGDAIGELRELRWLMRRLIDAVEAQQLTLDGRRVTDAITGHLAY